MSSTAGSLDTAVGEARFGSTVDWIAVRTEMSAQSLVVHPLDTSVGGEHAWAFRHVRAIEEIEALENDQVIEVSFDNGANVTLKLPRYFIERMLGRLAELSSASESTPPGLLPLAPGLPVGMYEPLYAASSLLPGTPESVINQADPTTLTPSIQAPVVLASPPPFPHAWGSPAATSPELQVQSRPTFTIKPKRSRRSVLIGAVSLVVMVVLAVMAFVFHTQASKAADLAESRGEQLAETKGSLDKANTDLAKANTDLSQVTTERDALKLRVSEVTNEKAQVQDERNVAQEAARLGAIAAQKMFDCRNMLLDAMSAMIDEYYSTATARIKEAVPVCQAANSAVSAFSDASS